MIRKKDFDTLGGFDKTFFAHQEEIDLCWKIHLLGKHVWSIPSAIVYHKNAVTLPMYSRLKQYLNHRNSLLMLLSNFSKRVYGICNSMAHKKIRSLFF